MEKFCLYLLISAAIIYSCSKDRFKPKYEGEIVLSSEFVKKGDVYNTVGFSFDKGKNVPYPYTTDVVPDLVVTLVDPSDSNLIRITFTSPNNQEAFYLNQTFTSVSDAKTWYESYSEAPESGYIPLADTVQINQVWTIQTINKKYAKLLIREIELLKDNPVSDYVEITVHYKYQPDGSRIFNSE